MKRKPPAKSSRGAKPTSFWAQERTWLILGCLIGTLWFFETLALPPVFKGWVCCDSLEYLNNAQKIDSFSELLTYFPNRFRGYPIFLSLHRHLAGLLGIVSPIIWLKIVAFTTLAIHFASSLFLYRTANARIAPIHPFALFLLLAHSGLTSHAAMPLTDTLSTSLLMLGAALLLRSRSPKLTREVLIQALLGGAALGWAVYMRPNLAMASGLVLVVGFAQSLYVNRKSLKLALLPLLSGLAFGLVLIPQFISCTQTFGTACVLSPDFVQRSKFESFTMGLKGFRSYTVLKTRQNTIGLITSSDPFFDSNFGPNCPVRRESAGQDLLDCFSRNWFRLPVFFAKKVMGLFDNFHFNTYSTNITRPEHALYNRLYSVLAFTGFLLLCGAWVLALKARRLKEPWVALAVFPIAYVALSSVPNIESRYSFQVVPFAYLAFAILASRFQKEGWRKHRWAIASACAAALAFWIQVHVWDGCDPMKYESIESVGKLEAWEYHYLQREPIPGLGYEDLAPLEK